MDILLETHGLPSTFRAELASLGPSIAEGGSLPSWYEALDVVVSDALATGQVVEARQALEWFEEALARALVRRRRHSRSARGARPPPRPGTSTRYAHELRR